MSAENDEKIAESQAMPEVDAAIELTRNLEYGDTAAVGIDSGFLERLADPRQMRQMAAIAAQPKRIGPYTVLQLLGSGGMGVVYKVRHDLLGKLHALKVLNGEGVRNADVRSRFQK